MTSQRSQRLEVVETRPGTCGGAVSVGARRRRAGRVRRSRRRLCASSTIAHARKSRVRAACVRFGRRRRRLSSGRCRRRVLRRGRRARRVRVSAVRRGDDKRERAAVARRGDTFGEEAALVGARRWATRAGRRGQRARRDPDRASTRAPSLGRAAAPTWRSRGARAAAHAARDLLRTHAFARDLGRRRLGHLARRACAGRQLPRQSRIYGAGDRADAAYLVVDGLVQLQTELDGTSRCAPTSGAATSSATRRRSPANDARAHRGRARRLSAAACASAALLRTLVDRNPGLAPPHAAPGGRAPELQLEVVGEAAARTTQHVFHDLYRMQMARSLLAIDQDSCVRCGHCAWACAETHDGVSRLVRRGDKVVTQLASAATLEHKSLMLPNSCQHCRNPACMIDCPTGAIGRDPEGEVFIREELCTGCGDCAKACPWDNIRMAPRGEAEVAEPAGPGTSPRRRRQMRSVSRVHGSRVRPGLSHRGHRSARSPARFRRRGPPPGRGSRRPAHRSAK